MLKGASLVAGEWLGSDQTFQNEPTNGAPDSFAAGTPELINRACDAAEEAFWTYGYSSADERAAFLQEAAAQIEARGADITAMGMKETGLPEARLEGERGRTVAQLRMFADHIKAGTHLDHRHDPALPDRAPMPRPDLQLMQRPMGPVAIFGASNFPLAFSSAGGDTAAALAAGCPVVVKGHPAHPGIADLIAQAFDAAIKATGVHPGVFSQVLDGGYIVGETLVKHPLIRAVGFTGSLRAGRALFDIAAARPEPIPFFGELGSINPMFILPAAAAARGDDIASAWAGSLTMGAGQFCTNPGIAVMLDGPDRDRFVEQVTAALSDVAPQTMLTAGIAKAFQGGCETVAAQSGVEVLVSSDNPTRAAGPQLFTTTAAQWLANEALQHEVFGPMAVLVIASDMDEMRSVARALGGQLTCTLHLDDADTRDAQSLMPILERKAGRLLANGFPTGVEVCDSMVHSGPYPASTNFGATSVGTMAIRRFLRPVCYQNMPSALLP
ncbi:aldehyde dehydrogenase (NADP(+)) [uncultured Tateyamaria sp.]|uniref:aldehyde dehydrogenase (NADP(+)) n=1 Tax=uncultured Tateyamaria sp. TaxID=455651 RepID=UPI00260195AA|nr:aldehyde dehydrogenase (NADP(+)) [uncultured Tateyamaria sp.]